MLLRIGLIAEAEVLLGRWVLGYWIRMKSEFYVWNVAPTTALRSLVIVAIMVGHWKFSMN